MEQVTGGWRKMHNAIHDLYSLTNIIKVIILRRGYNYDSDHFLVHTKIKQKLIPVKNKQIQKHKWDRQREKINKYQ